MAFEVSFRDLTSSSVNQPMMDQNSITFKLIKTVADFTQQLSSIHEQHAEELQLLVETFRKRNAELRRERPPYQSSLFTIWEVLLQEVEIDSQVHGDIARSLGRQVGTMLLEKTFYRKIQSRKIFLHRESFETILNKAEELLKKCHQDYSDAYKKLLASRNHTQLAEYYDMHNAYVQQLRAANGMLEYYHTKTLPKLLEELEQVYLDLSDSVASSMVAAAEMLTNKAREQGEHYQSLYSTCQTVNNKADLINFIKTLNLEKAMAPLKTHPFIPPRGDNESGQVTPDPMLMLRNELVAERIAHMSLPNRTQNLKQDVLNLESQIRQLQEAVDSLTRLQQRSLESNLYNKSNELQEDISMKRFDLQVANIHLAAVKAQLELVGMKESNSDDSQQRDRKTSSGSTASMKNKWLKAFRSLKTGSVNTSEKNDIGDKKNGKGPTRPQSATPSPLDTGQHIFQEYTYKKITPCDYCSQILRGHVRQGLKCKMCKMNVHADCQDKVSKCQPKPRLLRRQKSTSEIETKLVTPEPDEDKQEVDPIYQLLKQAGDISSKRNDKDGSSQGGVAGSINSSLTSLHQRWPRSNASSSASSSSSHLLTVSSSHHDHMSSSAPHSPRRQKLSLRMKSFSLDSPESSEHVHRRHQMGQQAHSSHCSSHSQSPQSPQGRRQFLSAKNVRMSSVDLPDDNEKSLSSASTSPCPSPKPHRLLPTNLYVVLYNFRSRHSDELDLKNGVSSVPSTSSMGVTDDSSQPSTAGTSKSSSSSTSTMSISSIFVRICTTKFLQRAGYTITVIDTSDPDWWQGKCLGKVGYFPSKYVTKLHPGEHPLQVTHTVQVTDGENGVKLLRDQIVIQIGEEIDGMVTIRTGTTEKLFTCPLKYLQEV